MGLKAPGILTFMVSIILTVTVLIMKLFGAQIPFLIGNVHRALPSHLGAKLDPTTWRTPSVMRLLSALGGLDDQELRAIFNGGLGMIVAIVGLDNIKRLPIELFGLAVKT